MLGLMVGQTLNASGPVRSILAAVVVAVAAGSAHAQTYFDHHTGSFDSTSTFGGVVFEIETGFSYDVAFDFSSPSPFAFGGNTYPVTSFSITVDGYGTYTTPPAGLRFAAGPAGSGAFTGITDSTATTGFLDAFGTVTPGVGTVALTDYFDSVTSFPFTLALTGVTGGLVMNGYGSAEPTSFLNVPEPRQYAALTMAALTLYGAFRARRGPRKA